MSGALTLRFFGPPLVSVSGQPLPRLRSRKGLYLLALLSLRAGVAVERDFLIGTLWPESDDQSGQESLRKTLGDLRAALGSAAERLASPRRGALLLDLSGEAFCDVADFDRALMRWEKSGDITQAETAAQLYRGTFMEGVLEDWALQERTIREEGARTVLEALASQALEGADTARALALVRRAEKIEPLRESVQRILYRVLTEAGDFPAAQRAFRDFRLRLRAEANLAPDPETLTLMQTLATAPRRALPPPKTVEESTAQPHAPNVSEGLRHFPSFLTALRGRQNEQVRLRESLETAPLTTLVGMGGMGKTRLAVAVAQEKNAAVFVDLAPLPHSASPEDIRITLCRAVGVAGEDAVERLRELFKESETLLVLDNGEPVLESLRVVLGALLQPEQRARLLVTSREPLGLRGERVLRLEPLTADEAFRLFQERAEAAGAPQSEEDTETVRAICRRLDGLPLAIELAAARAALLTPTRLLERLSSPLRLLSGGHLELPERQRSLRAVLEGSCALLEPVEREALEALSVFVGPFPLEDAEAVLESGETDPLDLLDALHRASLLVVRPSGWTFLQPVRDFAADRLAADFTRAERIHYRHAEWQAQVAQSAIVEARQGVPAAERRLWERAEERLAAFTWAKQTQQPELAARLAWAHACYLLDARRHDDAKEILEQGLLLTQIPALQQMLLEECAELALANGELELVQARIAQVRALSPEPQSKLLSLEGELAFYQGRSAEAHAPFWAGFECALVEGSPESAIQILSSYAHHVRRRGTPELLIELSASLERGRGRVEALWRADRTQGTTLQALATIYRLQRDDAAALTCLEELVALRESQRQAEPLADARFRLGALHFRVGRPEEAEAGILRAVAEHRARGNDEAARQVLVNGLCRAKFTRWFGQAMRLRQHLIPELSALDPTYYARTILFEGCVLMRHGSPQEARERLLEAAQRFRWLGDSPNEAVLLRLAAWTYLDEGDTQTAQHEAQRLLVASATGRGDSRASCRVFLAEVLRRQGNITGALEQLEGLEATPEAHPALGLCWLDRGELERAESEFQAACTYGESELSMEWLAYSSVGLAQIAQRRGQSEVAIAAYDAVLTRARRAEDRVAERLAQAGLSTLVTPGS